MPNNQGEKLYSWRVSTRTQPEPERIELCDWKFLYRCHNIYGRNIHIYQGI